MDLGKQNLTILRLAEIHEKMVELKDEDDVRSLCVFVDVMCVCVTNEGSLILDVACVCYKRTYSREHILGCGVCVLQENIHIFSIEYSGRFLYMGLFSYI